MRKLRYCGRVLAVLLSMGVLSGGLGSCTADLLRDVADDLEDTASQIDDEPQTIGEWWDDLWD